MIYPENFEKKIGFDEIRIQLKGRCISSLGTEKVDEMTFMTKRDDIVVALTQVEEYTRFMQEEDELFEEKLLRRATGADAYPAGTHLYGRA